MGLEGEKEMNWNLTWFVFGCVAIYGGIAVINPTVSFNSEVCFPFIFGGVLVNILMIIFEKVIFYE